ncbi:MAG TPA: hypothetical protein VIZ69_10780 [Thermoanaerobaculia bacterium]
MKARATAIALVLAFLGTAFSRNAGACCPPTGQTAPMVRAVDCCAAMLESAPASPAALTTAVRRTDDPRTERFASVVPAAAAQHFRNWSAAPVSPAAPSDPPPLQRRHAQLLI